MSFQKESFYICPKLDVFCNILATTLLFQIIQFALGNLPVPLRFELPSVQHAFDSCPNETGELTNYL